MSEDVHVQHVQHVQEEMQGKEGQVQNVWKALSGNVE